ncbi:MAG: ABC-F family ATP-binding cassette domain-containing protein [Lewinellaceae bacterium]|nr:ABC-F family ATP-binding cassette domain-containing protein [Lewinellaceae bacterium]
MNYLTLENITKSYGEKVLFQNIDMTIDRGQKIGLIAKNGSGKSTLLSVIGGKEGSEGENAKIIIRKGIRIGWLDQDPDFFPELEVLDAALDDDSTLVQVVRNYEHALAHPENTTALQDAMAAMDDHKAWSFEAKVKELLFRFSLHNLEQKVKTLSGGQKKRLALVKILLQEPDFLILDEPTNHLDVEMIEWLEEYLQHPGLTLFMVTHDRYFLENVCDSIIELDNGQLYRYKGSYSDYLEKKALREEVNATTYDRQKKLLKRELDWVRKSPAARTVKAKARVDSYYDRKENNESLKQKNEEMTIQIKESYLGGKIVECHNISKHYGDRTIVDSFTYKFKRKERVGIVGPNGAGKSTFLQLITQNLDSDTGKVIVGETVQFGYYRQDGLHLNEDKRVIDVVRDIAEVIPLEKGKELNAAQLLERFLFNRAQQQVYASQLSGGERRRLYLVTVLMKNPNFLILDEPTNDLDVMTLQVLEDFLEDFPGCLVVVTHDRYFMDRLVDHLFIFEGHGKIKDFNGTYLEYRALRKEKNTESRQEERSAEPVAVAAPKPGLSNTERNEMRKLEKDIARMESRKAEILNQFNTTEISPADATKLSAELGKIQDELEEKEMRWLELADQQ